MGEKRRRERQEVAVRERLLAYSRSGALQGAPGTAMETATPEQVVESVIAHGSAGVMLDALDKGLAVIQGETKAVDPDRLVDSWMKLPTAGGPVAAAVVLAMVGAPTECALLPAKGYGDAFIEDDRNWFTYHPDRCTRLREVIPGETEGYPQPEGCHYGTAVINLDPSIGLRQRYVFCQQAGTPPLASADLSPVQATAIILEMSGIMEQGQEAQNLAAMVLDLSEQRLGRSASK